MPPRGLLALALLLLFSLALLLLLEAGLWIEGQVLSPSGPQADARVRFQGETRSTQTDATGRFRLPWRAGRLPPLAAWHEGYFIASGPSDASLRGAPRDEASEPLQLLLKPLPADDNEHYAWVDPRPDPGGEHNCANCHREIYREWSASSHARSAGNRRFLDLYAGTDWHGRPNVGWSLLGQNSDASGVCTACHAPSVPLGVNDPANYDLREVKGVARQGVHCDFCHKVADVSSEKLGVTHGRFGLKLLRPTSGQLFFGPLDDVIRGEDAFAPVYRESHYCASCHEGVVLGVHVYSTFSEWLASPARRAGQQCQTCHMAPTGTLTNIAPGKGGIERNPATLASHRLRGGQADMLRRCLRVAVAFDRHDGRTRAAVLVHAENVGHRVPTGYIDRHLLLVVEPLDRAGERLSATGPTLPSAAGKTLAGRPGRLYAKLLHDDAGHSPAPFWNAHNVPADNRLRPDQPDRADFLLPPQATQLRVRLLYRRFWQDVADVKGWPDNEITVFEQTRDIPLTRP